MKSVEDFGLVELGIRPRDSYYGKGALMKAAWVLAWTLLATGLVCGTGRSQEVLYLDPDQTGIRAGSERFTLMPVETPVISSSPLFLGNERAGPMPGNPDVPPLFPDTLQLDLGFKYLQPHFDRRAVALVIPAPVAGAFPVLASASNLSNDFGFVPQLAAGYDFGDIGFGFRASGSLTSIKGDLERTSSSDAGVGNLTASANVNIAVANFLEGSKRFYGDQFRCFRGTCLEDGDYLFTLGGRYSHVDQTFTANLTSGNNQANLIATQNYNGFGPTASLSGVVPVHNKIAMYWITRGSLLIGNNERSTSNSVAVAGNPGSGGIKLTESRTMVVPVGETELGLAWGVQIPRARGVRGIPPPLTWVKIGAVIDVWGQLGLLPFTDGPNHFSDGRLSLYGFSLLFGFQH